MNDYRIALRRAWQADSVDGNVPARVDLPTTLDPEWRTFRLRRRFQTPEIDTKLQQVLVRLERVPGLRAVALDGESVTFDPADDSAYEFPVSAARGSRVIQLNVDATDVGEPGRTAWGHIHVIIRELTGSIV